MVDGFGIVVSLPVISDSEIREHWKCLESEEGNVRRKIRAKHVA